MRARWIYEQWEFGHHAPRPVTRNATPGSAREGRDVVSSSAPQAPAPHAWLPPRNEALALQGSGARLRATRNPNRRTAPRPRAESEAEPLVVATGPTHLGKVTPREAEADCDVVA